MPKIVKIEITGWTNHVLKSAQSPFVNAMCTAGDRLNESEVRFCPDERRRLCKRHKRCALLEPRSYHDELKMVRRSIFGLLTNADRHKIARILAKHLAKCRRVRVIIEVH